MELPLSSALAVTAEITVATSDWWAGLGPMLSRLAADNQGDNQGDDEPMPKHELFGDAAADWQGNTGERG